MDRLPRSTRSEVHFARRVVDDSDDSYDFFPSTVAEPSGSPSRGSGRFEMATTAPLDSLLGSASRSANRARGTPVAATTPAASTTAATPATAPQATATQTATAPAAERTRVSNGERREEADPDPERDPALGEVRQLAREIGRGIALELRRELGIQRGRFLARSSATRPEPGLGPIEREEYHDTPYPSRSPCGRNPPPRKPKMYWLRPRDGVRPAVWGGLEDAFTGKGPDVFVVKGDPRPGRRGGPSTGSWSGWRMDDLEDGWIDEMGKTMRERAVHIEMPWARRSPGEKYNFWGREFESRAQRGRSRRLMDQELWWRNMQLQPMR